MAQALQYATQVLARGRFAATRQLAKFSVTEIEHLVEQHQRDVVGRQGVGQAAQRLLDALRLFSQFFGVSTTDVALVSENWSRTT